MSGEFGALQPHVSRLKKGEGNMGLFSTLSHSVKVIVLEELFVLNDLLFF